MENIEQRSQVQMCNVTVKTNRLSDIERLMTACPSIWFTDEPTRDIANPELVKIHYSGYSEEVHWFEYVMHQLKWEASIYAVVPWIRPLTLKERITGKSKRIKSKKI